MFSHSLSAAHLYPAANPHQSNASNLLARTPVPKKNISPLTLKRKKRYFLK
jgi:hypothetical protein